VAVLRVRGYLRILPYVHDSKVWAIILWPLPRVGVNDFENKKKINVENKIYLLHDF
jgi:hypothetical protein